MRTRPQATVRRGAKTGASRLLANVNIQVRVAELNNKVTKALDFDAEWIREQMRELHDHAKRDGGETIMGHAQLQGKMLDMMSKCEGMQTQKHEIDGRSQITFNIKTSRGQK